MHLLITYGQNNLHTKNNRIGLLIQDHKKMKNTSITFEEALIDMVRFYGDDTKRRACTNGDRFYMHNDGRRCAIGRIIKPQHEAFFRSFDGDGMCGSIEAVVHEYQKRQLISGRTVNEDQAAKELTIVKDATLIDLNFLQIIHDEDSNWDESGLSPFGIETIGNFRLDLLETVVAMTQKEDFIHQ